MENCLPREEPSWWSRSRVWGVLPLRRNEQQRQRVMNWPQPPFPIPLCHLGWGGREFRSEVEPGKKGAVGARCIKIWLYFSLSYSDFIGDKLNSLFSPSSVCFVRHSNWWVISPRPCLDPRAFHHISSPLSSWGGGVIERFWWAPGIYPGKNKTYRKNKTCSRRDGSVISLWPTMSLLFFIDDKLSRICFLSVDF